MSNETRTKKTNAEIIIKELTSGTLISVKSLDEVTFPGEYIADAANVTAAEGFPVSGIVERLSAFLNVIDTNKADDNLMVMPLGQKLTMTDGDGVTSIYHRSCICKSDGEKKWEKWITSASSSQVVLPDGAAFTIDEDLSTTSANAIQNKTVAQAINKIVMNRLFSYYDDLKANVTIAEAIQSLKIYSNYEGLCIFYMGRGVTINDATVWRITLYRNSGGLFADIRLSEEESQFDAVANDGVTKISLSVDWNKLTVGQAIGISKVSQNTISAACFSPLMTDNAVLSRVDELEYNIEQGYLRKVVFEPVLGSFYDNAARLVEAAAGSHIRTKVTNGCVYKISGTGAAAVSACIFLNSRGGVIERVGFDARTNYDMTVTPPEGAVEIIVNSYKYDSTSRAVVQCSELVAVSDKILVAEDKPLSGKTILCLGDSITQMNNLLYEPHGMYSDFLAQLSGATVINCGIGGTRLSARSTQRDEITADFMCWANLDLPSLAEALYTGNWTRQYTSVQYIEDNSLVTMGDVRTVIDNLSALDLGSVDVVTIFIGTNDASVTTLGEEDDTDPVQNICGAMNVTIKYLLSKNPNLKIFYFSPIVRYFSGDENKSWDTFVPEEISENPYWSDNYVHTANNTKFTDLVQTCIKAAQKNKIPVCDMYNTLGVNEWNFRSIMRDDALFDGTHPYRGLKRIAERMYAFIKANL